MNDDHQYAQMDWTTVGEINEGDGQKKKMSSPKEEALYVVAGLKIFQNPQGFTSAHYISPFQHHAKQFFLSPLQNIKFHINHW